MAQQLTREQGHDPPYGGGFTPEAVFQGRASAVKDLCWIFALARGRWQAAERRRSGYVLGRVDLAHAGQREHAGAGQVDAQFQGTAGSFHEPAQGGEVEVGLALDLDDGRLLDAKTLGDLLLAALGELAQGLEAFNVSLKPRRPLGDARLALGRHGGDHLIERAAQNTDFRYTSSRHTGLFRDWHDPILSTSQDARRTGVRPRRGARSRFTVLPAETVGGSFRHTCTPL